MGNREKFAAELGKCSTISFVEGNLEIREEDGNVFLAVKDNQGRVYPLHSFVPSSTTLTHRRVQVRRAGGSLKIDFDFKE